MTTALLWLYAILALLGATQLAGYALAGAVLSALAWVLFGGSR